MQRVESSEAEAKNVRNMPDLRRPFIICWDISYMCSLFDMNLFVSTELLMVNDSL